MYKFIATAIMLLNAKCDIACKYEGYDTGVASNGDCACIEYFEQGDLFSAKYNPPKLHIPERKKEWSY